MVREYQYLYALKRQRKMTFKEVLPQSCPPSTTVQPTENTLWRLLFSDVVDITDFDSQFKKNPKRNFPDPCGARSVSLVTSLEVCRSAIKSPRMPKFTHAVQVLHNPSSGVWHKDKPTHVHWWPYKNVNFSSEIFGSVEKL